ncbi:hypothetical protein C3747_6g382 [Trypanosoma cruzi]|uniref:Uncharacterized protein n=1 Tax=Trypanosoma cruzi TaxID=5693 RepID=A0A2V2XIF2_TRYCR|nr:hypothetical protein C3747_6g382 [Trypanosoma cruzi]
MRLILTSLRHWRTNDVDLNNGLVYLIRAFILEGMGNIFFNAPFLFVMRDILSHGEDFHNALHNVCDQVVYDFFNPSFAKLLDEKRKNRSDMSLPFFGGAQSFLGFEVALRCVRSLFSLNSTDYSILEEKGLPHLTDFTVIPLKDETQSDKDVVHEEFSSAQVSPVRKSRRKNKVSLPENRNGIEENEKVFSVDVPIEIPIESHFDEKTTEEFQV